MTVLGIHMSRSDSPGAVVTTNAAYFDAQVSDFAWHLSTTAGTGRSYFFGHDEAAGDITWYHWCHNAAMMDTLDDGYFHSVRDANDLQLMYFNLQDGIFTMVTQGTTNDTSNSMSVPLSLTRFDMRIDTSGSGLTIDLYLDGGTTPSMTGTVADRGARTKPALFLVRNVDSADFYVSELYMADFDTRNTRPVKQTPDAVGNYTGWTGGWAELGDEDILTAADGINVGDKVSVNLDAYPGPASPGGILAVVVKTSASRGLTGPQNLAPFVRIGGVDYAGSDLNVNNAVENHYTEFDINPGTSLPWTTADLDTMEIGLEAKT